MSLWLGMQGQYDVKMDFIQVSGVVRLSPSTTSAN